MSPLQDGWKPTRPLDCDRAMRNPRRCRRSLSQNAHRHQTIPLNPQPGKHSSQDHSTRNTWYPLSRESGPQKKRVRYPGSRHFASVGNKLREQVSNRCTNRKAFRETTAPPSVRAVVAYVPRRRPPKRVRRAPSERAKTGGPKPLLPTPAGAGYERLPICRGDSHRQQRQFASSQRAMQPLSRSSRRSRIDRDGVESMLAARPRNSSTANICHNTDKTCEQGRRSPVKGPEQAGDGTPPHAVS